MTRPQGYRQSAAEAWFCLFALCLPYYQSLLLAGLSGVLWFLLLSCLMVFVVARSPELRRSIAARLRMLPREWLPARLDRRERWIASPLFAASNGPSLEPLFQRPPPLFA